MGATNPNAGADSGIVTATAHNVTATGPAKRPSHRGSAEAVHASTNRANTRIPATASTES